MATHVSDAGGAFVDGDFAAYCKRMRKDAEWGGNVELQALSQTCMVNVTIHQLGDPFMEMLNFDVDSTRMVHVRCVDPPHSCHITIRLMRTNCHDTHVCRTAGLY